MERGNSNASLRHYYTQVALLECIVNPAYTRARINGSPGGIRTHDSQLERLMS